jgi:FkbM family methyltransferase
MIAAQKSEASGTLSRITRFLQKPWPEKAKALKNRWDSFVRNIPVPARLPFGARWIRRHDNLAVPLFAGAFEKEELAFVERFVQPGMTVLDIGAHHGLYTLLASQRVRPSGRVFSFEPSPRERKALRLNVALNFCRNVGIQSFALGSQETNADLFVVKHFETGCNSLRPPVADSEAYPVRVRVTTLDAWLQTKGIQFIDFIKLDVEGAELEVLKGATRLLKRIPRPVILAEVQDVRTRPWGYCARDIIEHLENNGYKWFTLRDGGFVEALGRGSDRFEGNFVACPQETIKVLETASLSRTAGGSDLANG